MTDEMQQAYDEAALPFVGGAITAEHARMKSWRYFLEINSAGNLR